MANAQTLCLDNFARLPEFRQNVQEVIRTLCVQHQIVSIPVSVKINATNLVFPTDNSYVAYNPFENVEIQNNTVFDRF